jgi:hypothetical protein
MRVMYYYTLKSIVPCCSFLPVACVRHSLHTAWPVLQTRLNPMIWRCRRHRTRPRDPQIPPSSGANRRPHFSHMKGILGAVILVMLAAFPWGLTLLISQPRRSFSSPSRNPRPDNSSVVRHLDFVASFPSCRGHALRVSFVFRKGTTKRGNVLRVGSCLREERIESNSGLT